MTPPTPRSTLFPYTTLFRSLSDEGPVWDGDLRRQGARFAEAGEPVFSPVAADELGPEIQRVDRGDTRFRRAHRSEEHTSELQSLRHLVCRLLLEKKKNKNED